MKKNTIHILLFLILLISACNGGENNAGQNEKEILYTCPMHPEIIRNEPGKCPECGMQLIEKTEKEDGLDLLLKPTNEYTIADVRTIHAKEMELPIEITANGKIVYDTERINTVAAVVDGYIEKLYVKYAFQPVYKGQKLMDIYSKDLALEQENYLFLLSNDKENTKLIKATEKRLQLLGLTDLQISEIQKNRKSFHSITVYSPYFGHLHDFTDKRSGNKSMDPDMEKELLIAREGMAVVKGQSIFTIYNIDKVWGEIHILNENIGMMKKGLPVKVSLENATDILIDAEINFISPSTSNGNTTIARVNLDNKEHLLKTGMLINAKIHTGIKKGIFAPRSSVVYTGKSAIVFIKEKDSFRSRKITIGLITDDHIEILSGITESEELAENAQMLMDSESFIKSTYEK